MFLVEKTNGNKIVFLLPHHTFLCSWENNFWYEIDQSHISTFLKNMIEYHHAQVIFHPICTFKNREKSERTFNETSIYMSSAWKEKMYFEILIECKILIEVKWIIYWLFQQIFLWGISKKSWKGIQIVSFSVT